MRFNGDRMKELRTSRTVNDRQAARTKNPILAANVESAIFIGSPKTVRCTKAINSWTLTHSSDPQLMVSVRPRNNPQLLRGVFPRTQLQT